MRWSLLVVVVLGCGGDSHVVPPPTDPAVLSATLDALAAMGQKQAGTMTGAMAASYIQGRFTALGLTGVHTEPFGFPRWELQSKALTVTIAGVPSSPGFDVFEASGSGDVDAPVIDVGTATEGDLAAVDLTGKIAMVRRDPSFHRSSQLRNVAAKGAVAMLYLSVAPENLRQVGSVRLDWEAADSIPAITIGADDAATIKAAITAGSVVTAHIAVVATSTPGIGASVVARIPGERSETIVCGAHFDTWFMGSSDNGSGIAELLEVAHRRMLRGMPKYTLVFVAYDGEEIGLYGGYDYYRKHALVAKEPILAVLNFESPSAINPDIAGLVHSNQPKLDAALQAAHLRQIYAVYAGLEIVAQLFGGIIPTDIQGDYRGGVPTVTTAVTNPYYHTMKDTPETVDLQLLADSVDGFDDAIENLLALAPDDLQVPDPALWTADVTGTQTIDVVVKDGSGAPQSGITVKAAVLVDDFMLAQRITGTTDATGHAQIALDPAALAQGAGNRFLHVTAGPVYPLVEKIVPLP
jgi:Zn-dependent M28 family amino/carboxypeptidase